LKKFTNTIDSKDNILQTHWYSLGLPVNTQIVVWLCIIVVLFASLLNLTLSTFNITIIKSLQAKGVSMKMTTALCFILSSLAIVMIQVRTSGSIKRWGPKILSAIIIAISIASLFDYIDLRVTGRVIPITHSQILDLFLSTGHRMSPLTAVTFISLGAIIYLLSVNSQQASDLAHILIFPTLLASYFIPASYMLNIYPLSEIPEVPVALNTGISFCALSLVVLLIRRDTWLMEVFTSRNMGGMVARRLLPFLILLPGVIGWLRIQGERTGILESEIGVVLVALLYAFCFVLLIWISARSVNRVDEKRIRSDVALKKAYADLADVNSKLQKELTDRILIDEALKQSELKLKEMNATKDKFFNIIAHDLKNPFTSLMGSSELLYLNISQLENKNIVNLAKIINDSAKNGYAILQNLLDWSRSQTGLLTINPENINIRNLIDEGISNISQLASNKEIEISSETKDDIFVVTDKNMMKTILRNLLSNAIKFSYRKGKVIISAVIDHNKVIITVKDNGIGIPEENLDKLFRIDTKISVPGTENEMGTSLGLKLCKEFAEKLGAKIWVESIENKGSDFYLSLPLNT
jgi:signal transduction histidine kinase